MGYLNFCHTAYAYDVVSLAVVLHTYGKKFIGGRIGVTGFADHAFRAKAAENMLAGYERNPEQTERILEQAFEGFDPVEDRFANGEYRRQIGRTMLRRALADASARK